MKRCPQCEFIYEDDQSLCDMDGILLVFDSQRLPRQVTTSNSLRSRLITAAAVFVLTTVLFLVYYVSTYRQSANGYPPTPVSGAQSSSFSNKTPANTPETKVTVPEPASTPEMKPPAAKVIVAPVEPKRSTKPRSTSGQKTLPPTESQKDDSKIGSLIKKTGRILKKPFKF
jgi:type IV secretory pathway VirB10-like protein